MNQGMPQAPQPGVPQQKGMPGMPAMPMVPGQMNPQQMQNLPINQKYAMLCSKILPSCNEKNPHLKDQVGQTIFEFVSVLVQKERAPKITGMLIEIPVA